MTNLFSIVVKNKVIQDEFYVTFFISDVVDLFFQSFLRMKYKCQQGRNMQKESLLM